MQINLLSDTVTKATPAMLDAMMSAPVGDDVFGQDPSINALEARAATMFGKEAALFCPSGTMTNQIAVKCHTQPLDEIVLEQSAHIYRSEGGAYAFHSGVAVETIMGQHGIITADQIQAVIKPTYDWLPRTRLVCLENSCNIAGGNYYTVDDIRPITKLCKDRGLRLHLDGARLFNVLVETGESTADVGACFDTISICMSKGLGAPVGSLLLGDADTIRQARRYRKIMGGGMRQAGYLAAACTYALDHHVDRLHIDNARAKQVAVMMQSLTYVATVRPVKTNILIFDTTKEWPADKLLPLLYAKGIMAHAFGPHTIRFVFHLDITEGMMDYLMFTLPDLI